MQITLAVTLTTSVNDLVIHIIINSILITWTKKGQE